MDDRSGHPRALLAARGLRPKKHLGQHFLMDAGASRRIATLAVAGLETPRVIEVGAGTGALTAALVAAGAEVTAIEVDPDLVAILRDRTDLGTTRIVHEDALAVDYRSVAGDVPWIAAGNLPYNVATPLITGWTESGDGPIRIVAMVQRDVADRFVAAVDTKAYGSLTLAVTYRYVVRRAFVLGPNVFFPRPNVDSAVVVLERRPEPAVAVRDPAFLFRIVRGGFAYRRKTLANSLALALDLDRTRTQAALTAIATNADARAEQLGLAAFAALADALTL